VVKLLGSRVMGALVVAQYACFKRIIRLVCRSYYAELGQIEIIPAPLTA